MNELDDPTSSLQQQPIPTRKERHRQKRSATVNLDFINRMSRPKLCHAQEIQLPRNNKDKKLGRDEILTITNRLHSAKRTPTEKTPVVKTPKLTHTEVTGITERLQRPLRRPVTSPNVQRGPPKEIHELESFVERLSAPRKSKEKNINRKVQIERRELNKQDIQSLCHRLADPNYTRKRTPDTNRILDRTFSPVNTYAWQGLPYNPIDWKIYFPQ